MRNLINIGIVALFIYLLFNLFIFALPIIIIFIGIRILLSIFGVKKQKKTYYYRYNGQNTQDFNDFFRNSGFGGGQQRGQSYGNYGGSYGSNPYFEDKSKYYTVLGVSQGSSQDEIKKAYRNKAREYHPDKHAQSSDQIKMEAEKRFKEINEAYEKLKD